MSLDFTSVENFVAGVAGGAIVKPAGLVGAGGFLFDVAGQDEITMEAEATDHYVEDNTAVQDHVINRPMIITLKGYMGEIKDVNQNFMAGILGNIQSLGDIGGLAPGFSQQAAQVYSQIESVTTQVDSVLSQAQNIYSIFNKKSTTQTPQQKAFQYFQNLMKNRILCTVETPFNSNGFKNMLIIRVGAIEREDSKTIADFIITFKEFRTVSTSSAVSKQTAGRITDMIAASVGKGTVNSMYMDTTAMAGAF